MHGVKIKQSSKLRNVMRANDHIAPVRSYGPSMRISGQGFAHIFQEAKTRAVRRRVTGSGS